MAVSFPKLHVFFGAGGVGKTTLSASFALSLACSGRKVGLLSIDPARRLQSALGDVDLSENGGLVALPVYTETGELRAAMLNVGESLKRWVYEQGMPPESQERLFANPYFNALSEKMATAADTLAAIRVAEWVEQYPEVEDLVIDTPPGLHAIDFVAKPEKVMAFLDSKLVDWIKWFVGQNPKEKQNFLARAFKSGARKVLDGLALVGGRNFLVNFGEFLLLFDQIFVKAVSRLQFSRRWMADPSTRIVLVSSIREDAVTVSFEIGRVLKEMGMTPTLAVINRAFSQALQHEVISGMSEVPLEKQDLFANFIVNYCAIQGRVQENFSRFAKHVISLPIFANLSETQSLRLTDLVALGENLRKQQENGGPGGT